MFQVACLGLLRPADGHAFSQSVAAALYSTAPELVATAAGELKRYLEHGPGRAEAARGGGAEVWGDGVEAWAYLLAAACRVPDLYLRVTAPRLDGPPEARDDCPAHTCGTQGAAARDGAATRDGAAPEGRAEAEGWHMGKIRRLMGGARDADAGDAGDADAEVRETRGCELCGGR